MVKNPINQQENNFRHVAATAKNKTVPRIIPDDIAQDKEETSVAFADNSEFPSKLIIEDMPDVASTGASL